MNIGIRTSPTPKVLVPSWDIVSLNAANTFHGTAVVGRHYLMQNAVAVSYTCAEIALQYK